MNKLLHVVTGLFAGLFLLVGLGWLLAPGLLAAQFEMPLLEGMARSTQIADLASFFLTLGACMLMGVITRKRVWFFPAMMLLGFAAFGRILAWLAHGAAFAPQMIAVEALVIVLLYFARFTRDPD